MHHLLIVWFKKKNTLVWPSDCRNMLVSECQRININYISMGTDLRLIWAEVAQPLPEFGRG